MARYEHLQRTSCPLHAALRAFKIVPGDFVTMHRDALALAVHLEQIVASFSRYHKYTLGTELRNAIRRIVTLIIQTNNQSDKQAGLPAIRRPAHSKVSFLRLR